MEINLSVKNLSITISNKILMKECSFTINKGDAVLLDGRNGIGKSTLIKTIVGLGLSTIKKVSGEIYIKNSNNILAMNERELLSVRSQIAYLEQKDNYEAYYGISVMEVLKDSYGAYIGRRPTKADTLVIEKIFKKYMPENSQVTLKSKINKLSGGQQRMVSIISSLCLREDADLFILDEPLNNLDMNSIVLISNILNQIKLNNPNASFLIVTHCKIFPFINKVVTINEEKAQVENEKCICHACFGEPDEYGFY